MQLTSPGKLVAILAVIIGCFAFIVAAALGDNGQDTTPAWATLTLVTGYLIGNGTGAKRGEPQQPVFSPRTPPDTDPAPSSTSSGSVLGVSSWTTNPPSSTS